MCGSLRVQLCELDYGVTAADREPKLEASEEVLNKAVAF